MIQIKGIYGSLMLNDFITNNAEIQYDIGVISNNLLFFNKCIKLIILID